MPRKPTPKWDDPEESNRFMETAINGPYGTHRNTTITHDGLKRIAEFTASLEGLSAINRKKRWIEALPHLLGSAEQ